MNDHPVRNLLKLAASYLLCGTGLVFVLTRLFVRRGLLVFNYHGFSTFANDPWRFGSLFESGYARNFEKQVRYLEKRFDKLAGLDPAKLPERRPAFFLTFDDGYKDNHDLALPVLVRHAVPAVFFLATGVIGTDRLLWYDAVRLRFERERTGGRRAGARAKRACKRELERLKRAPQAGEAAWPTEPLPPSSPRLMMDWDEVREAAAAGIRIGAHTETHPVLSLLPPDVQRREIETSMRAVRRETGGCSEIFSFPDGRASSFSGETLRILAANGLRYALTTDAGLNGPADISSRLLKRIGLNPSDPVPVVALKVALTGLREGLRRFSPGRAWARAVQGVRQFGPWNAVRRSVKAVLRRVGVHAESYYILERDLTTPVEASASNPGLVAQRIALEDLVASPLYGEFPAEKQRALRERFSDPRYEAHGARRNGRLVYMAWIGTDALRIEAIGFVQELRPGEGALLDAYTLPEVRGLGIHGYMNRYRLARMRDKGLTKAYVAILSENRPALKSQISAGFRRGERVLWLGLGRFGRHIRRPVDLSSSGWRRAD